MSQSVVNDRASWLQGPSVCCSVPPPTPDRVWRVVLLGAPGVGKGTQAGMLRESLGACHLSTGDVFRAAKALDPARRSPAMNEAMGYMSRGELVPDEIVLNMVRERLACLRCHGGFLLDGFPRTVAQATALEQLFKDNGIALDAAIDYDMPIDQIVERLSGRRTCTRCKAVYHVTGRPPKAAGICDTCGGELIQREDDRPEAVRVRMEAYVTSTAPLQAFYRERGLLVTVPAEGTPEEIRQATLRLIGVRTPA